MYRQGELLIRPGKIQGERRGNLVLAEGEATGHKHAITKGSAELYEKDGVMYLSCESECELTHPDHDTVTLPKGNYEVITQREYVVGDDQYRKVLD